MPIGLIIGSRSHGMEHIIHWMPTDLIITKRSYDMEYVTHRLSIGLIIPSDMEAGSLIKPPPVNYVHKNRKKKIYTMI